MAIYRGQWHFSLNGIAEIAPLPPRITTSLSFSRDEFREITAYAANAHLLLPDVHSCRVGPDIGWAHFFDIFLTASAIMAGAHTWRDYRPRVA